MAEERGPGVWVIDIAKDPSAKDGTHFLVTVGKWTIIVAALSGLVIFAVKATW